jgi:hypothetical protein
MKELPSKFNALELTQKRRIKHMNDKEPAIQRSQPFASVLDLIDQFGLPEVLHCIAEVIEFQEEDITNLLSIRRN